jgi:hypothetical protein
MEPDPELTAQLKRVLSSLETLLPRPVPRIDWAECVAANWRKRSFSGYLEPIENVENLHLEDLLGIEEQKRVVEENTRQFLAGLPANNILLWGSRGTGNAGNTTPACLGRRKRGTRRSSGPSGRGTGAAASRTSSPPTGLERSCSGGNPSRSASRYNCCGIAGGWSACSRLAT